MPKNDPLKKHKVNLVILTMCMIGITITVGSMFVLDHTFIKKNGNLFLILASCIAGVCLIVIYDSLKKEKINLAEAFTIFIESLRRKK
jgi:uncharacterized membrane protein